MIDYQEIKDGDAWELFCRDYLVGLGLVVEIPPGRGPDGGQDLLIREQLKGSLLSKSFTWLVSCKHYAVSGKAVGTADETNIIDRLAHHNANGFLGFYSTIPSSSLITRLKELRDQQKIQSFKIFDGAYIENGFHDAGLSGVMLQHLPTTHTALRPIHPLLGEYQPLPCEVCGKDLLKASSTKENQGVIVFGTRDEVTQTVNFVCKGECDQKMSARTQHSGLVDFWDDIDDYCNPLIFIRRLTGHMADMRRSPSSYSDDAYNKLIELYLSVSQRTLRQTNSEDREEYFSARQIEEIGL